MNPDVTRSFDEKLCSTFVGVTARGKKELAKERALSDYTCHVRDHEEARRLHETLSARGLKVVT